MNTLPELIPWPVRGKFETTVRGVYVETNQAPTHAMLRICNECVTEAPARLVEGRDNLFHFDFFPELSEIPLCMVTSGRVELQIHYTKIETGFYARVLYEAGPVRDSDEHPPTFGACGALLEFRDGRCVVKEASKPL